MTFVLVALLGVFCVLLVADVGWAVATWDLAWSLFVDIIGRVTGAELQT